MRYAVALLLLLPLAGCISPLQQLKSRNPSADDFASADQRPRWNPGDVFAPRAAGK